MHVTRSMLGSLTKDRAASPALDRHIKQFHVVETDLDTEDKYRFAIL
jgi:hypothetical protein